MLLRSIISFMILDLRCCFWVLTDTNIERSDQTSVFGTPPEAHRVSERERETSCHMGGCGTAMWGDKWALGFWPTSIKVRTSFTSTIGWTGLKTVQLQKTSSALQRKGHLWLHSRPKKYPYRQPSLLKLAARRCQLRNSQRTKSSTESGSRMLNILEASRLVRGPHPDVAPLTVCVHWRVVWWSI